MTSEQEKTTGTETTEGYTAVVYFHGMGEQRRYEEVSRLVDALDAYAHHAFHGHGQAVGTLEQIRARLEPPRGEQKRDMSYVRVYHRPPGAKGPQDFCVYRFYEAYWAPITAGGHKAWAVFKWMLHQVLIPLQTLSSPWRARQRLRRAALHSLWERMREKGYGPFQAADFAKLLYAYNGFERPDSRRKHPEGRFPQFLAYLGELYANKPDTKVRLEKLALRWRRRYVGTELRNLLVLVSLVLALLLGLGGLFLGVTALLDAATGWLSANAAPGAEGILALLGKGAVYGQKNAWGVVVAILSFLGITGFLRNYMGDVQLWTTYEETDTKYAKRREILKLGADLLTHVLSDKHCERVVVVAHSLGTAVAVDSLLELGRHNRARHLEAPMLGPLEVEKLDHFVTMGSPVDKIHYFFESQAGKYHRYNRVVEEVRGDIGTVPFAKNRKPYIHWVNYWDQGDVISGALETPSNPQWAYLRVDNVQVRNFWFPDPGASHSGYFQHEGVIGDLFSMIFQRGWSFRLAPGSTQARDYEQLYVGPGKSQGVALFFQAIALLIPWLAGAGAAWKLFGLQEGVAAVLYSLAGGLAGALVLGWAVGKLRGHLMKLKTF